MWMPSNLSQLTLIVINIKLTYLGLEAPCKIKLKLVIWNRNIDINIFTDENLFDYIYKT